MRKSDFENRVENLFILTHSSGSDVLRTVPTIVIAHKFCASPDTRICGGFVLSKKFLNITMWMSINNTTNYFHKVAIVARMINTVGNLWCCLWTST